MKTFATVEDYIEIISGARDLVTGKLTHNWFSDPIISLARYDVNVIDSMSDQASQGVGLTEKQADLAVRIILKYRRQLATKGVDVTPIESPVFRTPIRKMDYSCSLAVVNDRLQLRFPYNTKLIELVRSFSKESQGFSKWNPDSKVWELALTEYNLNWAYTFSMLNKFEIGPEVQHLHNLVLETETVPYAIELTLTDTGLSITNAPQSMLDYLADKIGEISFDNFYSLVDYAPILGYTVDRSLLDAVVEDRGIKFLSFISSCEMKINPESLTDTDITELVNYAKELNRFPIVIFEPDLGNKIFSKVSKFFDDNETVDLGLNVNKLPDLTDKKVIHTAKAIKNMPIPLLISNAGLMFGGEKQLMQQNSEKVVYIAVDVYNPTNKNKKVSSISG